MKLVSQSIDQMCASENLHVSLDIEPVDLAGVNLYYVSGPCR